MISKKNVELLVVVLIIAFLAVIAFIILNPINRLAENRNVRRLEDVNKILTAVYEYRDAHEGVLPLGLKPGMNITQIGTANDGCDSSCVTASASACINLNSSLAKYLKSMPTDPDEGTQTETGYYVFVSEGEIVSVGSCKSENSTKVEVSK